jgi:hypothetical protein
VSWSGSDEELISLASEPDQLTSEALSVLHSELAIRRIEPERWRERDSKGPPENALPKMPFSAAVSPRVGDFIAEVLNVFHKNFWLYFRLVVPALIIGYIAIFVAHSESREIARKIAGGVEGIAHNLEFAQIGLLNFAGFSVSWLAFCFSFAAICWATDAITIGEVPSALESFARIRGRTGPLLRLSLLLFSLLLVAEVCVMLLETGVLRALHWRYLHVSSFTIYALSFAFSGLALLVLSRFALAIPAVVLDNLTIGGAMFRSDELTEGKWASLAILLAKSLIGSYVAGMCPYCVASWLSGYIPLPVQLSWILAVGSIACVSAVEPVMFVGFALLYSKASERCSSTRPLVSLAGAMAK